MRRFFAALVISLLGVGIDPGTAAAHHSFAMYDQTRTVTLTGAVKTFLWTNPHVMIWFSGAPVTGGTTQTWTIELTSPGNLTRMGWTRTSLKPGDNIEVQLLPLRDGEPGGAFVSAKNRTTGQVLSANWVQQSQTAGHP
jgi:hypothetical protein